MVGVLGLHLDAVQAASGIVDACAGASAAMVVLVNMACMGRTLVTSMAGTALTAVPAAWSDYVCVQEIRVLRAVCGCWPAGAHLLHLTMCTSGWQPRCAVAAGGGLPRVDRRMMACVGARWPTCSRLQADMTAIAGMASVGTVRLLSLQCMT
jgi:hypothetical protein